MDDNPIRTVVRGAYDLQKLRISTGNRVCANFRAKLGQAPGEREEDALDDDAKKLLADLKQRHSRITDAWIAAKHKGPFPGDELISTFTEYTLVANYLDLDKAEGEQFGRLRSVLDEVPTYIAFLSKVRGIGPAMAGVIVSEFDITKAKYPSSLWAYAGLDVASDGAGRSKRKEHLVKREYTDRNGEVLERDGITYNPWLKTKLMGVLAPSFLRSASPYAQYYRDYRHRIETDPKRTMITKAARTSGSEWSKLRVHMAAERAMIKRFLADLYVAWRTLEGLPVAPPYSEAKQGHIHRDHENGNHPSRGPADAPLAISHPLQASEPK
jgi:hypothetical protein